MRISDWSSDVCSSDLGPETAIFPSVLVPDVEGNRIGNPERQGAAKVGGDGLQRVDADPDAAINDIVRRRIGEGIFAKDVERYAASADPARRVVGRSDDVDGVDEAGQIDLVELGFVTAAARSEEHTSELQSLMRTSYAVFCL